MKKKRPKYSRFAIIGAFAMLPFLFVVPPIIGWLAGRWLDETFHTTPFFEFGLILLGLIAGFREVYKLIRQFGDF